LTAIHCSSLGYLSAEVWNPLPSTPRQARTALILKQTWTQAASGSNLGSGRKTFNLYSKNVHFKFRKGSLDHPENFHNFLQSFPTNIVPGQYLTLSHDCIQCLLPFNHSKLYSLRYSATEQATDTDILFLGLPMCMPGHPHRP